MSRYIAKWINQKIKVTYNLEQMEYFILPRSTSIRDSRFMAIIHYICFFRETHYIC